MAARSRIKSIRRKELRRKVVFLTGIALSTVYILGRLNLNPVQATIAPGSEPIYVDREVEVVKEVEVDRTFTTEKQQILAYMVEKFGDDAEKAITLVYKCENSTFDPKRKSGLNIQQSGRRSYDIGVMQINVDENNLEEQEKLTNWKYNIDRGYSKYKAAGNKFTAWTCAHVVGQKNYLGQ